MIKMISRTAVLAAFGLIILLVMNHYGLFAFENVIRAFSTGGRWVAALVATHTMLCFLLVFRYKILVKLLGLEVKLPQLTSATFVSSGIGQWAPGALAITEVVRMSLMLGSEKAEGRALSKNASRFAVASLYDRFVGFFTMLTVGGFATTSVLISGVRDGRIDASFSSVQFVGLLVLCVLSFGGASAILVLPFAAKSNFVHALLDKMQAGENPGAFSKNVGRAQSLVKVLSEGSEYLPRFVKPVLLSFGCMALSCVGLWFASKAIGEPLPLFAIFATFPVTAIATLFPLGFGGMGIFGVFGVAPAIVSSASVLQNAVILFVNTLLGVLYANHSSKQIYAVLRGMKS
jgi:uncharacterized membrane protein YbhN (UPF0104 family)